MLAIAGAVAENMGIKKIYYGAHSNDRAIYPDCRPTFIAAMKLALHFSTYAEVELIAPFADYTKADIVAEGLDLGVFFEHTWSCYEGKDTPCGKCGTCQERIEAFEVNDAVDPLMEDEGQ